ncbi:MAG: hypothetical protein LUD29_06040, partial [Clostridia bacterium]|nr:hypothetical protein [Clostridia bacterium]
MSISGGIEVSGTDAFIYLGGAVVTSELEVKKATLNLDLDGGTLKGDITVSSDASSEYAVLVISDSSADAGVGEGMVDGHISGVSSDISVEAGTFTDENVGNLIALGSSCLIGEGGVVIALDETYAEDFSEAYSVDEEGNTTYYTTFLSAAEHLAYTGGKVVLTASSSMSHTVEIWAAIEVELNSSLFVDLIINADDGGSLSVSMAALTDGELSASPLTGKIVIKGDGKDAGTENKYGDTLVFTDGVRPVGDLEIDLDALDGENCGGYMVGEKDFAGSGVYGITTGNTHIHVFDIETWKIDYDGRVTLLILCACGEAEDPDEDDDYIAKTVEITENADGSYTFRAEVIVGEGEDEKTYVCDKTVFFAATVVDVKGKTYYFESLQEAVDFVSDYDGCEIALKRDIEESVEVSAGNVAIDLNGKTWTADGDFVVKVTGGNLVIYGEGTILGDIYGTARLRGGSYSFGGAATLADFEKGYVAFITTDCLCVIIPKSEAQNNSAASVLTGDVLSYYESLEDAVCALEEGSTLTLWADASEKFMEVGVSVTIDLGGFGVGEIEASANVTILGSGFVDTLALA